MTIKQLKSRLVRLAKRNRAAMAPLLYRLREKIKAQGIQGEGFGAWCEVNLDISRRTADRWANEYAHRHGLKTFGQMTKSRPKQNDKTVDGKVTIQVSWVASKAEHDAFVDAFIALGQDAQPLIYRTVIKAAQERRHAHKGRSAGSRKNPARSFAAHA